MTAGRFEEALLWADRAVHENAGAVALRLKLSLCGYLRRLEEGKECLRLLQAIHPEPTIIGIMRDLPKGMSPKLVAAFVEGWRKAGMPDE